MPPGVLEKFLESFFVYVPVFDCRCVSGGLKNGNCFFFVAILFSCLLVSAFFNFLNGVFLVKTDGLFYSSETNF